ncbi:MAG: AAA family ATPase [Bryobacteraceae bacterium]
MMEKMQTLHRLSREPVQTSVDHITIRGFKSIASIDKLPLRPVNILIGANGAGKSNFVEAFSFLAEIREGRLDRYVRQAGGAERLLHFGSKHTTKVEFDLSFANGVTQYELSLIPTQLDQLVPLVENVAFWNREDYSAPEWQPVPPIHTATEAGISDQRVSQIARHVRDHLDGWRVFHFHDTGFLSGLRKTSELDDNRILARDGSNLAAILYLLQERHPKEYDLVRKTIQLVAPYFENFQLAPRGLEGNQVRLEWRHRESDQYFDVSALSDGTIRFIALATLFLQPRAMRPSVIVVDEPELGLHPYAIELLSSLVKQASFSTQIIVSTQSSLLLDYFEPDDVLVAERKAHATVFRRLESSELGEWLSDYSLGQLWEKNHFGGRPARD